nr:MAG TPA: hypothetical protein [Caudoviricetes sp.]
MSLLLSDIVIKKATIVSLLLYFKGYFEVLKGILKAGRKSCRTA